MHKRWFMFLNEKKNENDEQIELLKNTNVERIFSMIGAQWTDERNSMTLETVKGLVQTHFNFKDFKCVDFYNYISIKPNVLKDVRSSEKYT